MKQKIVEGLPVAGIIAFSGCSVNALVHWMTGWSLNPTGWYWVAAVLVEGCTAWLVWSIVDTARTLTKSRLSKQDRRFYKIVFSTFVVLAIPSISASIVANYVEFQTNPLLSVLFPVLTIASAVGAGLPDIVRRHKEGQKEDKAEKAAAKKTAMALAVRQEDEKIPPLSDKAARLSWLRENWPMSDVYPADLADTWQVTLRTVSRYLAEMPKGDIAE